MRLVLPDTHVPYQDVRLVQSWLDFAKVHRDEITGVDIIGDLIDCYSLSSFDKNPLRKETLQDELDGACILLASIRKILPKVDIRYSEGNHEQRLKRVLWGSGKAFAGLRGLTVPKLLDLATCNISWHPLGKPYKIHDLYYMHGQIIRKHAGSTGRATSDKIGGGVMMGHTHRMGYCPQTMWCDTRHAYECGHLTDYRQLEYVSGTPNWQQGWAVVHFPEKTHQVEFITVKSTARKRSVLYRGEVFAELPPVRRHLYLGD